MKNLTSRIKVRKIIKLSADPKETVILFDGNSKQKNKRSKSLKPIEKSARRLARANVRLTETYLKRHKKSSAKKKDGWLRDYGYNVHRSMSKHAKTMKVPRLLRL